jgi:hypothetical protein
MKMQETHASKYILNNCLLAIEVHISSNNMIALECVLKRRSRAAAGCLTAPLQITANHVHGLGFDVILISHGFSVIL